MLKKSRRFDPPVSVYDIAEMTKPFLSLGNQYGEGWFLAGEMLELITHGTPNIVRKAYPAANIVAVDYDSGAGEVNQLIRIKLMLSTAHGNNRKG